MGRLNTQLFLFSALAFSSVDALAFGWDDLWKRADQQVKELIELESYDEAASRADTPEQNALIKFRAGDFDSSAEMYGQSSDDYNHGTALTRAGDYAAAIEAYDQILADSDEYKDAMHNRKIAQKLAELQKQQQDQQGEGDGEGSGEQGQPQPGEQPSDSQGQPGGPSDSEAGEENQDSPPSDGQGEESDQSPEQEPADGQPSPASGEADEGSESKGQPEAKSHDEKQQAMEQWLQRVPDDPAGLLRARIIREHQRNYADSQDKEQAW